MTPPPVAELALRPEAAAAPAAASGRRAFGRFVRWGWATVALVYLLILAGATVRATGSGMGCPDWPRCFGLWVPPTDASQLPADYATRFAIPGHVPVFNAFQTWVEYLNRLLGALTGLVVLGALLAALPLWRTQRPRVWAAAAAFVLVGFNAWLGKLVVDSVLAPGMVTVHLLAALAVVAALLVALRPAAALPLRAPLDADARFLARLMPVLALVAVLGQFVLGTEVRAGVDAVAARLGEGARAQWLEALGGSLRVHRAFAAALVLVYALWLVQLRRTLARMPRALWAALALAGANAAIGFVLVAAGLPAWAQPLHLLAGTLLVGLHVWLVLLLWRPAPAPSPLSA